MMFSFKQDSLIDNMAVHSGRCVVQWRCEHQIA